MISKGHIYSWISHVSTCSDSKVTVRNWADPTKVKRWRHITACLSWFSAEVRLMQSVSPQVSSPWRLMQPPFEIICTSCRFSCPSVSDETETDYDCEPLPASVSWQRLWMDVLCSLIWELEDDSDSELQKPADCSPLLKHNDLPQISLTKARRLHMNMDTHTYIFLNMLTKSQTQLTPAPWLLHER